MTSQQLKAKLKFQFQRYILKFLSDQMPIDHNNTVLIHNNKDMKRNVTIENKRNPRVRIINKSK